MVILMKRVTKVNWSHPQVTISVCTKFDCNLSDSLQEILQKAKNVNLLLSQDVTQGVIKFIFWAPLMSGPNLMFILQTVALRAVLLGWVET